MNTKHPLLSIIILLSLLIGGTFSLRGQLSVKALPRHSETALRLTSDEKAVILPVPSNSSIETFIKNSIDESSLRLLPIGIPMAVDFTPENSGTLRISEEGEVLWSLTLEAPGATFLQLYFEDFELPSGGRLFLLDPEGGVLRGAFTEKNNTSLHALAIAPVEGDRLQILYEGVKGDPEIPKLLLQQVVYGLWNSSFDDYDHPGKGVYSNGEPWFGSKYSAHFPCAPNVVAFPEWERQAHSQVLIIVRGTSVCSGSLINNTREDGTAYILTASHCMNSSFKKSGDMEYVKESARQSIFFFNFRSPLAEQMIRGVEEQSLSGAEVVAYDEETDLCLLRITGVDTNPAYKRSGGIPASFLPYYSGWNVQENPIGPFTNLHHPYASTSRLNLCNQERLQITDFDAGNVKWAETHYYIPEWTIGTTAGGSSGSPLYDREGLLIGALTGGKSTCENPTQDAFYALSKCFETDLGTTPQEQLAPWLSPGSSVTKLKGFEPYAPLSPQRLSYNRYSLLREDVEFPKRDTMQKISGVVNSFDIPTESRLLGLVTVMNPEEINSGSLPNIVAWSVDTLGQKKNLLCEPMQLPSYSRLDSSGTTRETRTLIGWIESFIPLESLNVELKRHETLFIGFEMPNGKAFPFGIMRGKDNPSSLPMSFIKRQGAEEWQRGNEPELPSELLSRGNYWIDPIVLPLEEAHGTEDILSACGPSVYILAGTLRLIIPEECPSHCVVTLYSLEGERLFSVESDHPVSDFSLPSKVIEEKQVVAYLTYGEDGHYGTLLITNM